MAASRVNLLADQVVVHDDRDWGEETANEGRFGYASRHLLIGLEPAQESDPEHALLRGRQAQVQIRTVLQHAWAEFEHDIRYKGSIPEEQVAEFDDPRLRPRELAAFLAGQYPDAGWSRTDHYAWIAGLVLELCITSLTELGETLRSVDAEALTERMDYRYPPGAVRRLDDAWRRLTHRRRCEARRWHGIHSQVGMAA